VLFSPDGDRLATSSADGTVRVWNADGSGDPLSFDFGRPAPDAAEETVRVQNADGSVETTTVVAGAQGPQVLSFDPLGRRLLVADNRGSLFLYDLQSGAEATVIGGDDGEVFRAAFSPDGLRLAIARESSVELVLADGTGEATVVAEGIWFSGLTFSHDGSMLAAHTGPEAAAVSVWWLDGSGAEAVVQHREGSIWDFAFSPDDRKLATVSETSTNLWQIFTAAELASPAQTATVVSRVVSRGGAPLEGVRVTAVTLDDRRVAVSDEDGEASFRGLPPGPANVMFQMDGYKTVIREGLGLESGRTVAFDITMEEASEQGTLAASPSAGPRPAGPAPTPSRIQEINALESGGETLQFSPNGMLLAIGTGEGHALVWNVERGDLGPLELTGDRPIYDAFFSPNGALVATLAVRGSIRLWDASGPREPRHLNPSASPPLRYPLFSHDGRFLAAEADDHSVYVWGVHAAAEPLIFRGHEDRINQVVFSPDDSRLLTVSRDGSARIWSVAGRAPVVIGGYVVAVRYGAFSPDGSKVAIAVADGTVRVWNADGTGPPIVLSSFEGAAGVGFSPDGSRVFLVDPEGAVAVWRLDGRPDAPVVFDPRVEGRGPKLSIADDGMLQLAVRNGNAGTLLRGPNFERAVNFEHDGWVTDVEVSPDGTQFVTASNDGTARIWSVEGDDAAVILPHDDTVEQAMFDPAGVRVLTRDYEGALRIWEADGVGDPLLLRGRGVGLIDPAFSPDGSLLVAATEDGDLLMWRLTWAALLDDLRDVTTECLPVDLRRRFLGERAQQAEAAFAACEVENGR